MLNLPAFFTSLAPTSAKLAKTFMHSDFFNSVAVARASPLAFMAFMAAAFIAFGAIARGRSRRTG